jgi:multiple sugar transport system ATP-binding protein
MRASERNLAMVFQSYALYPHLSVRANMMVPLTMRDLSGFERIPLLGRLSTTRGPRLGAIRARVEAVAEILRLTPLLDRKPGQLSGGQRQRVALGRAMVREPVAFLMDEPLSNLDAALRVHMRTELAELHRQLGTTFIYVTHDQVEAMTMSSRIAVMLDGTIVQLGSPDEIYGDPRDIRVAEFIGSPKINIFASMIAEGGAPMLAGAHLPLRLPARAGDRIRLGIRPEHLSIVDPARAPLTGRLRHKENLGPEILLHVATPQRDAPVIVRTEPEKARALALDAKLGLSFELDDLRFFDAEGIRIHPAPVEARSAAYG